MKLKSLKFSRSLKERLLWKVDECKFGPINLIAGLNATGKTRILKSIKILSDLLYGGGAVSAKHRGCKWELQFESESGHQTYILHINSIAGGSVLKEELRINDDVYLTRDENGTGEIYAEELNQNIKYQIPEEEVAAFKKRDSIQHPFLDKLHEWSSLLRYYQFGSDMGRFMVTTSVTEDLDVLKKQIDLRDDDETVRVLELGVSEYKEKFKDQIKEDLKVIGYGLENIELGEPKEIISQDEAGAEIFLKINPKYICVKESDLQEVTEQAAMSQGMFRALALIIQLNYAVFSGQGNCILIDDIGEGLDYDRSSRLIKLVIEKAKKSNVQIIMTTNDRFVMNGVPLEYWSVLKRTGETATLYNSENSPNLFEDFELTGLSNFDFFKDFNS
jgi:hypothetical protein